MADLIRAAVPEDAAGVAALWNAMIRDTLATFTSVEKTADGMAQLIAARPDAFWVAAEGARVRGFVTFGAFRAGPGYAATVEHTIILAPDAQGAGLGRALMEQAMQGARGLGHHVMVAAISAANPDAVAFHTALGFAQTAHMPQVGRKAGRWLDLILMQKVVPSPDFPTGSG
jgi:phosphinothricin acetyltransferase